MSSLRKPKYSKEEVLAWFEEYSDKSKSAKSISKKFGIKHDTMLNYFKRFGLPLRPSGYQLKELRDKWNDENNGAILYRLKTQYIPRAKRKGLEFALTNEQIVKLLKSDCFYCGAKFGTESRTILDKKYPMMSIDRIDSSKGYSFSNCVTSCKQCNTMKMDIPLEKWFERMITILNKHKKI